MPVCSPTANSTLRSWLTTIAGKMLPDARTGRNGRDALVGLRVADGLATIAGKMVPDARTGWNGRDALVGLGVAYGNQGLAGTFPIRPKFGVAIAKELSYVKNARVVRLGPRVR